jgi:hypothetical protein
MSLGIRFIQDYHYADAGYIPQNKQNYTPQIRQRDSCAFGIDRHYATSSYNNLSISTY